MNLRSGGRRREEATIELTPLIDVVFLLLIFFMLTSSVSQQNQQAQSREAAIKVSLPVASSGAPSDAEDPIVLTVTQDGKLVLEDTSRALEGADLEDKLLRLYKKDPKARILLRGDKATTHGRVLEVLDAVKQIGFTSVDMVITRPTPSDR